MADKKSRQGLDSATKLLKHPLKAKTTPSTWIYVGCSIVGLVLIILGMGFCYWKERQIFEEETTLLIRQHQAERETWRQKLLAQDALMEDVNRQLKTMYNKNRELVKEIALKNAELIENKRQLMQGGSPHDGEFPREQFRTCQAKLAYKNTLIQDQSQDLEEWEVLLKNSMFGLRKARNNLKQSSEEQKKLLKMKNCSTNLQVNEHLHEVSETLKTNFNSAMELKMKTNDRNALHFDSMDEESLAVWLGVDQDDDDDDEDGDDQGNNKNEGQGKLDSAAGGQGRVSDEEDDTEGQVKRSSEEQNQQMSNAEASKVKGRNEPEEDEILKNNKSDLLSLQERDLEDEDYKDETEVVEAENDKTEFIEAEHVADTKEEEERRTEEVNAQENSNRNESASGNKGRPQNEEGDEDYIHKVLSSLENNSVDENLEKIKQGKVVSEDTRSRDIAGAQERELEEEDYKDES